MLASMSASAHARRSSWIALVRAAVSATEDRVSIAWPNARMACRATPNVPAAIAAGNISPNIIWNSGDPGRRSRA